MQPIQSPLVGRGLHEAYHLWRLAGMSLERYLLEQDALKAEPTVTRLPR